MVDNHLLRLLVVERFVGVSPQVGAALGRFDDLLERSYDAFLGVYIEPAPST